MQARRLKALTCVALLALASAFASLALGFLAGPAAGFALAALACLAASAAVMANIAKSNREEADGEDVR